ncbi:MAG: NuoI/complex I 23 kDa subunit family protein [Planctomycetota bacterium]
MGVRKVGPPERDAMTQIYLVEIFRGLANTLRHILKVPAFTVQYPEEKYKNPGWEGSPPGYHGEHRLLKDEKGNPKCVACFMCATACPAQCIEIEAEEVDWPGRDKAPKTFQIDMLRCIYCGICEDSCPKDAIELTTQYFTVARTRQEKIWDMEKLLDNAPDALSYNRPKGLQAGKS